MMKTIRGDTKNSGLRSAGESFEMRASSRSAPQPSFKLASFSGARWLPAAVAAVFFSFCVLVQGITGAWRADLNVIGDEAAHLVGSVMIRDYLVSGRLLEPLAFARDYYNHYPFFAVGYWPPAFHSVTALWFLIAGVGQTQALLVPAAFAAGTAWLIFWLVRLRGGAGAGICAGILYLSLPAIQRWMCAVMVDHFTAFFCVAAGVCVLRYSQAPDLRNGLLCAACCVFAVLSKYSAAYVLVLPGVGLVLARRRGLWRKPSFFLQPVLIALVVGPWVVWTRHLVAYGLPADRKALTLTRIASFVLPTFRIFPPVLMVAVILGLIALLLRPKWWREDVVVSALLGAGSLACLVLSPVGVDERYLLVPVASLLVLAAAGWSGAWSSFAKGRRRLDMPLVAAGLVVALAFVVVVARHPQPFASPIRAVVQSVQQNPAWVGKSILVPPDMEGAFIAAFVLQDQHRPSYYLLRPSKVMARMDWFGGDYHNRFGSSEDAMGYFRKNQVDLIVFHERPEATLAAHEHILADVLTERSWWRQAATFGNPRVWSVYQRVATEN